MSRPDIPETLPAAVTLMVGPKEIAEFLGRETVEVDRLIRMGAIPTWRYGSRAAATRESLMAWIAANAERAQAELEARTSATSISDA